MKELSGSEKSMYWLIKILFWTGVDGEKKRRANRGIAPM